MPVLSYYPNNSATYFNLTVEQDGVFTSGSVKFTVNGIDASYQNPVLKIFSVKDFGSNPTCIFSSELMSGSASVRETVDRFYPTNSMGDGFFIFQIWSDGSFVYEFDKHFLVLERLKTHQLPAGNTLQIYYAKKFFHNHGSGVGYCDTYINKLITYYNATWQKQVVEYQLNNGSPPETEYSLFKIGVNPYYLSSAKKYVFQYNKSIDDCYFSYESGMYIGITAVPLLFYPSFNYPCAYTEDEFLKIELDHEFYHGYQYTFNESLFNDNLINLWLIEGQARAIQTITHPEIEFKSDNYGYYVIDANDYLLEDKNSPFNDLSYNFCLFWRFLYENYVPNGSAKDKLALFRETCQGYSATTLEQLSLFMDSKLNTTAIPTFKQALQEFSKRAVLNDPIFNFWNPNPGNSFYADDVFYKTVEYGGSEIGPRLGEIRNSFNFRALKVTFKTKGKVHIGFNGAIDNSNCDFLVSLVLQSNTNNTIDIPITQGIGSVEIEIEHDNEIGYFIVTRTDLQDYQELGHCAIIVSPIVPSGIQKADYTKSPPKATGGNVLVDSPVSFVDKSIAGTYPITGWQWSFPGATPSSSTTQNPSGITYEYSGVYPVSLTITNGIGETDTKTVNDFITVYDPGEETGGNDLDISGWNPGFSLQSIPVSFNLYINSGLPPFDVEINFGDGSIFSKQDVYDLYYYETHSYATSGQYEVTYSVTDANGSTGLFRSDISIGFPGSHEIDFDLTWGTGFPDYLGENTWVTITDKTTGGYKPYTLWNWDYGKGINTGTWPINDANNVWETRWNNNKDMNFNGSPVHKVKFLAYDQYPINVQVVDSEGFMTWRTKIINVTPLPKCLLCDSRNVHPYDEKYKKHILKYSASNKYIWATNNFNSYFPWYQDNYLNIAPSSYCRQNYSSEGNFRASQFNAITNVKYKIERNGISYGNGSFEMTDDYMDHPTPYNWQEQNNSVYYCWWDLHEYHFYDGWFWRNWPAPIEPEDCPPYGFMNPPANCAQPYRTLDLTLPETGKYNFTFEIWNRNAHTPSECVPANSPNAPMYNYLTIPIYVVDCQADEYINTTISGIHDDEVAGNFVFANTSAAIIETDAEIIYQSCNGAIFNPGFTAKLGCDFLAQVSGFEDTDNSMDRFIEQQGTILASKPIQKAESIECYPNPSDGNFTIVLNSSDEILDVQLFSITGQIVNAEFTLNHSIADIHIVNPASSFYLLKVLTSNNKVHIKKIILQSSLKK